MLESLVLLGGGVGWNGVGSVEDLLAMELAWNWLTQGGCIRPDGTASCQQPVCRNEDELAGQGRVYRRWSFRKEESPMMCRVCVGLCEDVLQACSCSGMWNVETDIPRARRARRQGILFSARRRRQRQPNVQTCETTALEAPSPQPEPTLSTLTPTLTPTSTPTSVLNP